jgi:hypothetical protein
MGYSLFKDKDHLKGHFIKVDILSTDKPELLALRGGVDIISVSAVLHQWSFKDQVEATKRLMAYSRPNSPVAGYQIGNIEGKQVINEQLQLQLLQWRHDPVSFEKMWNEVGAEIGTTQETKARLLSWEGMG